MPDELPRVWYCGLLPGWGNCIWQTCDDASMVDFCRLRYIAQIVAGPRGEGLIKVPLGAAKGAECTIRADKILAFAPASDEARDNAMNAYGLKTIIAASPADLDKAPKLVLHK
jgi:hypothetical protein